MNRATVANLSNKELANLICSNQDIPRIVVDELVVRFVALVDNGTIDSDEIVINTHRQKEVDDETEELRDAIREAISVLESV